ncbi:MAG: BspA family leucine-rich repeat surface protein [Candidatus Woesearchaeota archaeon]
MVTHTSSFEVLSEDSSFYNFSLTNFLRNDFLLGEFPSLVAQVDLVDKTVFSQSQDYINITFNDEITCSFSQRTGQLIYDSPQICNAIDITITGFTAAECYDPANLGSVGSWPGCDGMLIVSRDMLVNAEWELPDKRDRYIEFEGVNYTFGDSEFNVFTGQVTDLSGDDWEWCSLIFSDAVDGQCWNDFGTGVGFNASIGYWDVSNVVNMSIAFAAADVFDQDIGGWDVSNVVDMTGMLSYMSVFDQDISSWDVSGVTSMFAMFEDASSFDQDLSGWDVSGVTNMDNMFYQNLNFDQDLSGWDVSGVTSMQSMFHGASSFSGQGLSSWVVSGVTDMYAMFAGASSFDQDLSGWDVSGVTDMWRAFQGASSFKGVGLEVWNISNVNSTMGMFWEASSFNADISGWDTTGVTNMNLMFLSASSFNQDLSGWCVEQIGSPPSGFDSGATSWVLPRPNWGDPC